MLNPCRYNETFKVHITIATLSETTKEKWNMKFQKKVMHFPDVCECIVDTMAHQRKLQWIERLMQQHQDSEWRYEEEITVKNKMEHEKTQQLLQVRLFNRRLMFWLCLSVCLRSFSFVANLSISLAFLVRQHCVRWSSTFFPQISSVIWKTFQSIFFLCLGVTRFTAVQRQI